MMVLDCDTARDTLPDVLTGSLAGLEAQAVLAHVAECPDCAAEAALIKALRLAPERAPAALAGRIRQAAPRRSWPAGYDLRRPALIAAAVASVLIGGSLLVRGRGRPVTVDTPAAPAVTLTPSPVEPGGAAPAPLAVSGAHAATPADGRALMQALPGTPDAALYASTATLDDLSEEELNTLLKELQS
jgi:hypothetical protein